MYKVRDWEKKDKEKGRMRNGVRKNVDRKRRYSDWNQYETNFDGNHWNSISKLDIYNVEKNSKLISHPSEETKLKETTPIILKVLVRDKTENLSERILDFLNW